MKTRTIKRIIGWTILTHLIPMILLFNWRFNANEYSTYHWVVILFTGYVLDIIIVLIISFLRLIDWLTD